MAVYKDKKCGTWYTSFLYVDWTGKRCRKLKRGFLTKNAAQNWENHFKLQKANSLDMTFEDFYGIYEADCIWRVPTAGFAEQNGRWDAPYAMLYDFMNFRIIQ